MEQDKQTTPMQSSYAQLLVLRDKVLMCLERLEERLRDAEREVEELEELRKK